MDKICTSCGANTRSVKGSVSFKCPSCGELLISRCDRCRKAGKTYTCTGCGFTGP